MTGRLERRLNSLEQARIDLGEKARSYRASISRVWLSQLTAGVDLTDDERQDAERRARALLEYINDGGGGDQAA